MTVYLSENIKRLRRENNLTRETLAEFLGVTFQSVSNRERGESYTSMAVQACDIMKWATPEFKAIISMPE